MKIHSQPKRFFIRIFLFLFLANVTTASAAEWYEGGNLHMATLRDWKKATAQNQLATCATLIYGAVLDNNINLPIKNLVDVKPYAEQLLIAINFWANSNGSANDNETVASVAMISMIQLNWFKESYVKSLYRNNNNSSHTPPAKNSPNPPRNNKTDSIKTSKSQQKVKSKPKLMSKNAAKEWVKNNVHLRLHFPLEDMKYRLGDYQATTIGNIERYYFPRINMTFFVIKSSQEFIGFSESEPSQKTRKEK